MEGNDGHVASSEMWIMNAGLKDLWSKSKWEHGLHESKNLQISLNLSDKV